MSVLTDLIYGGSNAVAALTEGAVNDAIAKYGAEKEIAFPDTAYFFPTIYAATGVKVKTLGDLPACVGVLKSLITNQEDLGQALNAGLATAVGAEILEGLKFAEPKDSYEDARVAGIGFVPDPIIRSLGVPLVTGDIPGVAVVLGKAENGEDAAGGERVPLRNRHALRAVQPSLDRIQPGEMGSAAHAGRSRSRCRIGRLHDLRLQSQGARDQSQRPAACHRRPAGGRHQAGLLCGAEHGRGL